LETLFSIRIDFYKKLFVAVIPALAIGFLLDDYIDMLLESVTTVAVMLVLGGIVLIFVDKWFKHPEKPVTDPSYKTAIIIGFFQCIAMIPGVSRSAASIIGGMTQTHDQKSRCGVFVLPGGSYHVCCCRL
jgi:undecaprenyl-diphosphatase